MKIMRAIACVGLLVITLVTGCSTAVPASPIPPTATLEPATPAQPVVLIMGSWTSWEAAQINRILARFKKHYPSISVQFDASYAPEYDSAILAQLESGSGPDLLYLRSFDDSRMLYERGFLEPLDDLPGLKENFSSDARSPWATEVGKPYGVPYIASSHGLYYNIDLFNKLGITVPTIWEELLAASQKIQEAGYIPFANSSGTEWTMAETVFMNLAPNFIGGRDGRMQYLNGQRCLNDAHVVAAFQAIQDIAPFLPPNQSTLPGVDALQLFIQGKAAMILDGSWNIHVVEEQNPAFTWGVFAPPPPAGQPAYITFHPDAGMGLNAASKHKAEAMVFLEWMTTNEFAELLGNELPGSYPMQKTLPVLANPHANSFLALNEGRSTDARFVWEKLMSGSPSAYDLVMNGAIAVASGEQSPQQAADALQAGVAQWYEPAQRCPQP